MKPRGSVYCWLRQDLVKDQCLRPVENSKAFLLGQAQRDGGVVKPFPGSIEMLTMCTKPGNHDFLLLDDSSLRLLACWHLLPGLSSLPRLYAIKELRFSVVPLHRVSRTHLTPAFLHVYLCVCPFPIPSHPQVSRTTPHKDMAFFHKSCHLITVTKIPNTHLILIWPQNCLMWLKSVYIKTIEKWPLDFFQSGSSFSENDCSVEVTHSFPY